MSRSTSSLSTFTTVPVTMSPSSNSTIVPEMASANDMPPRSSLTTCIGWYSPSASLPPNGAGAAGAAGAASAVAGAGSESESESGAGLAAGSGAGAGVAAGAGGAVASSSLSGEAGAPGVLLSGVATSGAGVLGPSCSN